ncbi:MFS general substrate transporter [Stipitochalara longipes BDJ]|nr:MFS general substrate transporter [Stipitochalara longipes BDJ]
MTNTEQTSRLEHENGIALASLAQPCPIDPPNVIAVEAEQDPASIGNPEFSRSSLIRSKVQLTATLVALFLSLFLAALDFSIATTATPTIVNELHSATLYTWIGSAYLLSSAAATPVWAKLSDIWGRKIILLGAVVTFAAGSAVCATSNTMGSLITGRSIQGSAAGGMIILTNICISDLFSMRHRGFYLGLMGVVWSLAGGIGPLLGGALTEYVSWRWNWWINLPISGLSFLILCLCLHVHNPRTNVVQGMQAVDWLGILFVLGMSLMFLLGLNLGGIISPWGSPKVICLLVFGFFASIIFAAYEALFAKDPIMPMRILRKRSNVASVLVCFMHGMASTNLISPQNQTDIEQVNVSSWYFLPLYFQSVKGSTPLHSGLLLFPITVLQSSVGVAAGVFIHRTGRYLELIWVGMTLTSLGFGLFIKLDVNSSLVEIVFLEIVAGIGVGLGFQPLIIALQSSVEQSDMAAATALMGFSRSLSTAISVVIGGVIFQSEMQAQYEKMLSVLPLDIAQKFSGDSAAANVKFIYTLEPVQKLFVKACYAKSLRSMWIFYASIAVLGLVLSTFISRQSLSTQHIETRTGLEKTGEGQNRPGEVDPHAA